VVAASEDEAAAHDEFLSMLDKQSGQSLWRKLQSPE
jgi:DNA polymerase-3 subunit epsilon